jgi:hypothetical protein
MHPSLSTAHLLNRTARQAGACLGLVAGLYASAWAGPHEHGVVHMTVAIEGPSVQLALRAPQESLLGYERAPREGTEKQQADKLIEQMRVAESVIEWNAQAQCKATSASVNAPGLQGKAQAGGHVDIEAQYRFECGQVAQLRSAKVSLFELSRRISRVQVQVAGPQGQSQSTLRRNRREFQIGK